MTQDEALDLIYECLDSDTSLTVKLRSRQGLDQIQFQRLQVAMEVLIAVYQDNNTVPKHLALCFVDITNFFYFEDDMYSTDDCETIEDAGIALSALANQLFSNLP